MTGARRAGPRAGRRKGEQHGGGRVPPKPYL
jgi:hypothetical protein